MLIIGIISARGGARGSPKSDTEKEIGERLNEVECQTEGEVLGRLCRKSNNLAHVVCYVNDPP